MLNILSPAELSQEIQDEIQSVSKDINLYVTKDEEELEILWPNIDIMFSGRITPEILTKAKNLKWFQATSAGVDRYMFKEFIESNILLTNVRGMHGQTISEHVLMKMLTISRKLPLALKQQEQKVWNRYEVDLLYDKNILIIGLGGIGKRVAELTNALGMNVYGVDINTNQADYVKKVYTPKDLKEALPQADFIVLAPPLTDETYHMISDDEFSCMKENVVFINISRGKVVNQASLIKALEANMIGFAALDVFENEPLEESSPLWDMNNVIITPHIAGSMPNYLNNATKIFIRNLKKFINNEPLDNLVDKDVQF